MKNWILRGKENSKEYTIGRIGSSHCLRTEIEQLWRRPLPFLSWDSGLRWEVWPWLNGWWGISMRCPTDSSHWISAFGHVGEGGKHLQGGALLWNSLQRESEGRAAWEAKGRCLVGHTHGEIIVWATKERFCLPRGGTQWHSVGKHPKGVLREAGQVELPYQWYFSLGPGKAVQEKVFRR